MSEGEGKRIDRRRFIHAAGALYAGALGWACSPDTSEGEAGSSGGDGASRASEGAGSAGSGASGATDPGASSGAAVEVGSDANGLPPRVVGMRSLGGSFRYDPVGLHVEAGDEVRWLNMGDFHTVSAFHPENADLVEADIPLRIPEGQQPRA